MPFQIQALDPGQFAPHFAKTDTELAGHAMVIRTVTANPGTPCRVSLADAEVGETVLLLNYQHQPADTPFRASHAIFVRQGAAQARLGVNEVPQAFLSRLMSIRMFDQADMMIDADAVDGPGLANAIDRALANPAIAYLHLHFAKQGCFAASVTRA